MIFTVLCLVFSLPSQYEHTSWRNHRSPVRIFLIFLILPRTLFSSPTLLLLPWSPKQAVELIWSYLWPFLPLFIPFWFSLASEVLASAIKAFQLGGGRECQIQQTFRRFIPSVHLPLVKKRVNRSTADSPQILLQAPGRLPVWMES